LDCVAHDAGRRADPALLEGGMSLVGSLEDLSLGDILQIISLSQKSGVLSLETNGCDGRIVFVSGLVRGAAIKDGPQDLRGVLIDGGFLSEADFERAAEHSRESGGSVSEAVAATTPLTAERIDSLCREAIEAAVVTMFSWATGDFSFDVRSEPTPSDPERLLPTGINAQYLAMEGARVSDESGPDEARARLELVAPDASAGPDAQSGFDEMSAHELFGVATDEEPSTAAPVPEAVETLARATLDRLEDDAPSLDDDDISEALLLDEEAPFGEFEAHGELDPPDLLGEADLAPPLLELDEVDALDDSTLSCVDPETGALLAEDLSDSLPDDLPRAGAAPAADVSPPEILEPAPLAEPIAADVPKPQAVMADPAAPPAAADARALVVVDGDLHALEWIKDSVSDEFAQVHIFQHTDHALARIRQYLVRGEPPVVLISPDMEVDASRGILDVNDFIARLKGQSGRLRALLLREEGSDPSAALGAADGAITRPERRWLRVARSPEAEEEAREDFTRRLHADIAASTATADGAGAERQPELAPNVIRRLRDATRSLTDASSRGEVLPLVIRFASESFRRVAMFMVRDGLVVGMAQHGLDLSGGPDDAGLRQIRLNPAESPWVHLVLTTKKPDQVTPGQEADRALFNALGDAVPSSAYLAPIESTGQVIALLYADNLPDEAPITDTSALEVVLHHAGLALDRAALERALREDAAS
jgi:hypothetical protein